jgi:hypothetical protein
MVGEHSENFLKLHELLKKGRDVSICILDNNNV